MKWSAMYRNPKTGAQRLEIAHARSFGEAQKKLPRWIYPDGQPHRRDGGVQIARDQ